MNLRQMRNEIERRKGQRDTVRTNLDRAQASIYELVNRLEYVDQARTIIQEVAQLTQKELEYHVSELVSLALAAVFDDPYRFRVDFVIKRERTECELYFERDGERINPMSASGGGAVDVAANALRFALWSLKSPRTRNTIVLDEPFRFLSKDLQGRAALMLKEISDKLGVQVIMVTHNSELIEVADRAFEVVIKNGVSQVKEAGDAKTDRSPRQGARARTSENVEHQTPRQGDDEDRADDCLGMGCDSTQTVKNSRRGDGGNYVESRRSADSGNVPKPRMAGSLRERARRPR